MPHPGPPPLQMRFAKPRSKPLCGPRGCTDEDGISLETTGRPLRGRPFVPELAEERQDQRRRLVGDREGLRAQLLLDLQRLEAGAFFRQVSVDEVADALLDDVRELRRKSFWMSRAAACEPIVASWLLRPVIAVSMAFEAVVAEPWTRDVRGGRDDDRIEPPTREVAARHREGVRSRAGDDRRRGNALRRCRCASVPSEVMARSS